jgi:hypothetical protein
MPSSLSLDSRWFVNIFTYLLHNLPLLVNAHGLVFDRVILFMQRKDLKGLLHEQHKYEEARSFSFLRFNLDARIANS